MAAPDHLFGFRDDLGQPSLIELSRVMDMFSNLYFLEQPLIIRYMWVFNTWNAANVSGAEF